MDIFTEEKKCGFACRFQSNVDMMENGKKCCEIGASVLDVFWNEAVGTKESGIDRKANRPIEIKRKLVVCANFAVHRFHSLFHFTFKTCHILQKYTIYGLT